MRDQLERLRDAWNGLSDREQRLLALMGGVAGFLVLGTIVLMTNGALADVKADRDDIKNVLAEIDQSAAKIEAAERARQASEVRYRNVVPPLGSYVETKASAEGLELRQVNEQPDQQMGKYRRRHVRVRLTGVELRPLMHLIDSLYEGNVPVAMEKLKIEHYATGDKYNVELGLYAFDLESKGKSKGQARAATEGD